MRSGTSKISWLSLLVAVTVVALASLALSAQQGAGVTPRTPDGKPDLSGMWGGGGGGGGGADDEPDADTKVFTSALRARNSPEVDLSAPVGTDKNYGVNIVNFERDSGIRQRMDPNKPLYKPEYWEKVQQLDIDGNAQDPGFGCLPLGVPRMGPPQKIVQTPRELIFLYGLRMTRIIPIDGRKHPPVEEWLGLWNGRSIGRWEGDELVIETVDFNDLSWLGWPGYFHSIDMKVTERMKRDGNTLTWQATVEDPVFQKPWVWAPRTLRLNPDPQAQFEEDLPCDERDLENMVTKERG
jgi:hypothetical protein